MAFPTTFTKSETAPKALGNGAHRLEFSGVHIRAKVWFLAFLTSFTQSWTSTWNTEQVYGRVDPIGTFQGNQRTISLTWDIPAGSLEEAKDNLKRMSGLAQLVYPTYAGTGNAKGHSINALTLSTMPLIRIKYANLVTSDGSKGLLGYITAITWTPSIDMGMFEDGKKLYPKVVNLNVAFNVLHEKEIGWVNGTFGDASFPFGG